MAQRTFEASVGRGEGLLGPSQASARGTAATALDLVHQAADLFRGIEEQARETEARTKEECRNALEKLRQAEMRVEVAERAQRELSINAEQKLQNASKALEQAKSRIEAQQDKLTALELRAQVAEADAREARQALALVEEAIRRRLLSTNPEGDRGRPAAA
ncbi:hypothetical protein [Bradyrhizobium iriomotense]|uniref:Uncharacterized protein n=1 Tax=Bradyrhizobium iriomotense TaxID=441950 RepID=A0ABQ6BEG1_9BRAD|nr:hypothetical protein [Bradyrhizobium iriomotense]GLR92100.1 hypothetical protein GCM10007857_88190 [Bradyrhizobium iriomotense]